MVLSNFYKNKKIVDKYRQHNQVDIESGGLYQPFITTVSYLSKSYQNLKFETSVTIDESAGSLGIITISQLLEKNISRIAPAQYHYSYKAKFSFRKNVGLTIKDEYNGEEYKLTIYNK